MNTQKTPERTAYGLHVPVTYKRQKFTVAIDAKNQPNGVFDSKGNLLPYKEGQPVCEATIGQWSNYRPQDLDDGDTGEARSEENLNWSPIAESDCDKLQRVTAQRDELLAALKACETNEGALGYLQPAKYARKRFDAINGTVFAAIAKAESN